MFEIIKAERDSAPITAAFIGGSGSGKTYSALKFARGLVGPDGKIVVVDTEGGRSKIYANDPIIGGFFHLDLVEPYTSERFREAFKAAVAYDADAIIIDTISHEHEGFLEFSDQEAAAGKNSRNKWIRPKAGRKRFYSSISSSHAHVIATIRLNRIVNMDVKPAVEIYKPECDKDFPYRLDLSVEIQPDHTTKVIKVPEPLIGMVEDGVMIDLRHGEILAADIKGQKPVDPVSDKIKALEDAAEGGVDILEKAWRATWRNSTDAEHPKLKAHLERLKGLAVAAERTDQPSGDDGDFGDIPKAELTTDEELDEAGLFQTGGGGK